MTLGSEGEYVLTRTFSEKPQIIKFRVAVPKGLKLAQGAGGFQGTVLGSVISPLTGAGTVEVVALAIY